MVERLAGSAFAYSLLIGRACYRHAPRLPLDEHAAIFSPPRGGKTGWLGSVILRYPGPVVSTTPSTGGAWNDTGARREKRHLKHRAVRHPSAPACSVYGPACT